MAYMNPKLERLFSEFKELYGWGGTRSTFAAICLKDAFVLDMMDQEFDEEAYRKELKALLKEAMSKKDLEEQEPPSFARRTGEQWKRSRLP